MDQTPFYRAPGSYGPNEDSGHPLTYWGTLAWPICLGPFSQRHATIVGAVGDQICCLFLVPRKCNLGKHEVRHEFLHLPDCPVALMGRDLYKLRAQ
jgi:hypothetical protein